MDKTGNGIAAASAAPSEIGSLVDKEWAAYIEQLLPIGRRLSGYLRYPQDPQARRGLYRSIFAEIAVGYLGLLYADSRYPDFWPFTTIAFNAWMNNPDANYYSCLIDDDGVYKISGYRGTVKRIDFQIGGGSFFRTGVPDKTDLGTTFANYDIDDDAHINADGTFEVILSRERPAGHTGDWWKLEAGATNILNRQISYDWFHEVDGRYGIERLDLPAIKPRPSSAELEAGLMQIAKWAEGSTKAAADSVQWVYKNIGFNRIDYRDMAAGRSAITTQKYAYGGFDLAPDEALVVEFEVPKQVRYWSFHLADDYGFMIDWMNKQTNINGHTAVIDQDGICRVVVSAQDPGVPNWLDVTGYQTGVMSIRWEKCSEWPEQHKVTKLKTTELRKYLPGDTPTISAEQRDAAIRLRRKGCQMRKRW